MYQMYLTLHVQVVFLQDDPANSLVIVDGLYSTCGENSSVNQPITLEPFSWYPTEVGIVGYWRYLAVVLKPAKYIKCIQICSIYLLGDIFEFIIQQG